MKKLKLLVAEGNIPEENKYFKAKALEPIPKVLKKVY